MGHMGTMAASDIEAAPQALSPTLPGWSMQFFIPWTSSVGGQRAP
jgi:hypothetical protein